MADLKKFTFDDQFNVTGMFELKKSKLKAEKLTGKTFDVERTEDNSDVLAVTSTKTSTTKVETTIFTDENLDDTFVEAFELEISKTVSSKDLEKYKFSSIDGILKGTSEENKLVVNVQELGKRGWKADSIDRNERLETIVLDGKTYVVKTETSRNGDVEFDLFRDGDGDGLWTKIAEGEAISAYVADQGGVEALLVGIADDGLLGAAGLIVG